MLLDNIRDTDVKVSLIQALIPEGLKAVNEKLQEDVRKLAGVEYRHGKENVRWGKQGGSVYLLDQKIPIEVPRLRVQYLKIKTGSKNNLSLCRLSSFLSFIFFKPSENAFFFTTFFYFGH